MYQHGNVDIRVLKEILGHENLGTTEIYTHLTSSHMERAANASPLAHVKPKTKKTAATTARIDNFPLKSAINQNGTLVKRLTKVPFLIQLNII